jgi:methyl-accepting chemotaxis protein
MTLLIVRALDSFALLRVASRIEAIATASSSAFKAMHNLRSDRSTTNRALGGEQPISGDVEKYLLSIRNVMMPALRSAGTEIGAIDFKDQATLWPKLLQLTDKMDALQTETNAALKKPKAERRDGLAKEYLDKSAETLALLETISNNLNAAIARSDATVDQLLMIKQAAWLLRNTAGEASLRVSTGLSSGSVSRESQREYTKYVGGIDAAWEALQLAIGGMTLPLKMREAVNAAKQSYFDSSYVGLRDRLIAAVIAGTKPEITATQWAPLSVERMSSAVAVAETALDEAKAHASGMWSEARNALTLQLGLLAAALVSAIGAMILVNTRVISPLHLIRDAMLSVAAGDLTADSGYTDRNDEIGALARALGTFRQQAEEKRRIEHAETERNTRAQARQQAIENCVVGFELQVREALDQLHGAARGMKSTSESMATISEQTNSRVRIAAEASGQASTNVESVAAAAEQLSASIDDISRQAAHAASIASRAVSQAHQTDTTVQGLASTAGRIGEVVGLINDIASQTNLLALNATIEAARAGEAGRGFAVVAAEVKSLASQTAKATEDISEQIADIQKVAGDAVEAIKSIGGIIGEVNDVAVSIAAAVKQQGTATQEISRSTQQAAQSTRHVSDNVNGVSAEADSARDAAEQVKASSETLGSQAGQLGEQVTDFLGRIRAA